MNTELKNDTKRHHIVQGALLTLFGIALGFGGTAMALIPQVTRNTAGIDYIRDGLVQVRIEQELERKRTDARVFEVVALMKELLATNRELMMQNRETMAALRERKTP